MHNGLDWIFTVVVLAQRDDSVSTSPKGGYDCLSIWWYDTLTAWNQAVSLEIASLSSLNVIFFWFASQPASQLELSEPKVAHVNSMSRRYRRLQHLHCIWRLRNGFSDGPYAPNPKFELHALLPFNSAFYPRRIYNSHPPSPSP